MISPDNSCLNVNQVGVKKGKHGKRSRYRFDVPLTGTKASTPRLFPNDAREWNPPSGYDTHPSPKGGPKLPNSVRSTRGTFRYSRVVVAPCHWGKETDPSSLAGEHPRYKPIAKFWNKRRARGFRR